MQQAQIVSTQSLGSLVSLSSFQKEEAVNQYMKLNGFDKYKRLNNRSRKNKYTQRELQGYYLLDISSKIACSTQLTKALNNYSIDPSTQNNRALLNILQCCRLNTTYFISKEINQCLELILSHPKVFYTENVDHYNALAENIKDNILYIITVVNHMKPKISIQFLINWLYYYFTKHHPEEVIDIDPSFSCHTPMYFDPSYPINSTMYHLVLEGLYQTYIIRTSAAKYLTHYIITNNTIPNLLQQQLSILTKMIERHRMSLAFKFWENILPNIFEKNIPFPINKYLEDFTTYTTKSITCRKKIYKIMPEKNITTDQYVYFLGIFAQRNLMRVRPKQTSKNKNKIQNHELKSNNNNNNNNNNNDKYDQKIFNFIYGKLYTILLSNPKYPYNHKYCKLKRTIYKSHQQAFKRLMNYFMFFPKDIVKLIAQFTYPKKAIFDLSNSKTNLKPIYNQF